MGPDERNQLLLPFATLGPGLGEPCGNDADCSDAIPESRLDGLEDVRGGDADDREVGSFRQLVDSGVRVNTGNGLTASVHGVRGSRVLGREDVAEKATSDRLASRGCADHNEAPGCEETL